MWEDLENKVKDWLKIDEAITVPGSGNGRSEEDVIGISTITQCKYTENKNASILAKDMKRLKEAAKLQDKFPLFVNESSEGVVVSIPECEEIVDILTYITIIKQLDQVEKELSECNRIEILEKLDSLFEKISKKAQRSNKKLRDQLNKIKNVICTKYNNLTTYNMFEDMNETTERPERSETEDSRSE